jgi:uncharacterized protein YdcH (DUF465 family)
MSKEKLKNHVQQLKSKHTTLQNQIDRLVQTHGPEHELVQLKKEKLRIKDELEEFERKLV